MESIVLQFDFLQNSMLSIFCDNKEYLLDLIKYYSDYYVENDRVRQEKDEVSFLFDSAGTCEIVASFYQINPKKYTITHPFKLCIDVIDDYIEIKMKQMSLVDCIFLHGSSVVYDGMPIILVGRSKSGKSTAVLKLLHELPKALFLSDDFLSLKIGDKSVEAESYRMPLHVRMGSLCFNRLYRTEPVDDEQMYIDVQQFGRRQETSFAVMCIFEISYGTENRIQEVQGAEKIEALMRNFKYYHSQMVKQIAVLASKIRVYQLAYSSDDFMVKSLLSTMHLKRTLFSNYFFDAVVKVHLARESSFYITVQGNSMYPALIHNQKVFVQKVRLEDICVGDVIFFQREDHSTVHRVVQITQDLKGKKFYTKGDNNEVRDPAYVLGEDIIGKVYIGGSL